MSSPQSIVVSMRLPAETGRRLKRMALRHGWTASDASARLVEEGLRRSEFAFIDFRDSIVGRQAFLQGSSLAVWEVMMLAPTTETPSPSRLTCNGLRSRCAPLSTTPRLFPKRLTKPWPRTMPQTCRRYNACCRKPKSL